MVHHNGKVTVPIVTVLTEMGHIKGPISLKIDNSTAKDFLNRSMRQKRSKSFDMRFHWMIEWIHQGQFWVYWDKGINNWVDYFTKHLHPTTIRKCAQNTSIVRKISYDVHQHNLSCKGVFLTYVRRLDVPDNSTRDLYVAQ